MYKMLLNESITNRYKTLEKNIKAKSNSFYDSYLDLIEETIKGILRENFIEFDETRTCGYLLKETNIREYLIESLLFDERFINKLSDHIKKCNDHKHKKEKNLDKEGMLNYLASYFKLINDYLVVKSMVQIDYDADYFRSIFGLDEIRNEKYKKEVASLKEELVESYEKKRMSEQDAIRYSSLLEEKEQKMSSLEEQNEILLNEISVLKDIKINTMEYKLNKTIDLLNELTESVVENRVAAYAIGSTIVGSSEFKTRINKEKEVFKKRHPSL